MLYFICSSLFCASSCDNIFFSLSYLQGKASGNKPALWLRSKIQTQLYQLGSNIQKNAGIFLFVGLLILAIFTFSLKNATLETRVEKLWVQGKPIFFFQLIPQVSKSQLFCDLNCNCSSRKLQEQVRKAFCFKKVFPFLNKLSQ